MASSLDDLTTPMTRAEIQAAIYAALASVGTNTTSWKPGAIVRTVIVVLSAVLAAFTVLTAQLARLGFSELSTGFWLRLIAQYVYKIDLSLVDATFATGEITLINAAGGVYDLDAGDLTITNTATGKSYRNVAAVHVGSLETVGHVAIIAIEIGTDSNADVGAITTMTTPLSGVSCTNPIRAVGRDDASDTQLRGLCSERLGNLSPFGPWDAYSYAAKTAKRADGSALGVTRVRLTKDGFGNVNVYLANPAGALSVDDVADAEDAIAKLAEPQGITATAISATARPVDVVYELWMYNTSGKAPAEITTAIDKSLSAFMIGQPISGNLIPPDASGKVYASAIAAAIGSTMPEIFRVDVAGGDVAIGLTEVPVKGTVTPTIHQVDPAEGHNPA